MKKELKKQTSTVTGCEPAYFQPIFFSSAFFFVFFFIQQWNILTGSDCADLSAKGSGESNGVTMVLAPLSVL